MHDLRILTLNCWNGRGDADAIATLLESRHVDVACFQELAPNQVGAITDVLPHGQLDADANHAGLGIAARRPIDYGRVPLPRRDGRVATLTPDAWPCLPIPVEIVNVHVQAPHVRPWRSLPLRSRQAAALAEWLDAKPATNRVLLGDLNSTALWPLYAALARRFRDGAVDAARDRGREPARTWGPWPSCPRLLRIDHVLTAGPRVTACEVLGVPGCDHSAVLADLTIE